MKLNCVVSATNEKYSHCAETFVKFWRKLFPEIDIKIFYIGSSYPDHLSSISDHIIFVDKNHDTIKDISTAFVAQNIRLYAPATLKYEEGVLITDIDMFPMNRSFYIDPIAKIKTDHFVTYRGGYFMCYNIASPSTWSDIFQIKSFDDCLEKLASSYPADYKGKFRPGWNTDQVLLRKFVKGWDKVSTHHDFGIANDLFARLDRTHGTPQDDATKDKITNLQFSDFHASCARAEHVNWVYDMLPTITL